MKEGVCWRKKEKCQKKIEGKVEKLKMEIKPKRSL